MMLSKRRERISWRVPPRKTIFFQGKNKFKENGRDGATGCAGESGGGGGGGGGASLVSANMCWKPAKRKLLFTVPLYSKLPFTVPVYSKLLFTHFWKVLSAESWAEC